MTSGNSCRTGKGEPSRSETGVCRWVVASPWGAATKPDALFRRDRWAFPRYRAARIPVVTKAAAENRKIRSGQDKRMHHRMNEGGDRLKSTGWKKIQINLGKLVISRSWQIPGFHLRMSGGDIFQIVNIPINYCVDNLTLITHLIPDLDLFLTGRRIRMTRKLPDSWWGWGRGPGQQPNGSLHPSDRPGLAGRCGVALLQMKNAAFISSSTAENTTARPADGPHLGLAHLTPRGTCSSPPEHADARCRAAPCIHAAQLWMKMSVFLWRISRWSIGLCEKVRHKKTT